MNSKVPHLVKCFESQVNLILTDDSKRLCARTKIFLAILFLPDSHCQARQSTCGGQQQRDMESR